MLMAARDYGVRRMVRHSTSEGLRHCAVPIDEKHRFARPVTLLCQQDWRRQDRRGLLCVPSGPRWRPLRPFSTYGPPVGSAVILTISHPGVGAVSSLCCTPGTASPSHWPIRWRLLRMASVDAVGRSAYRRRFTISIGERCSASRRLLDKDLPIVGMTSACA